LESLKVHELDYYLYHRYSILWRNLWQKLEIAENIQSLDIMGQYNTAHRMELHHGLKTVASFGQLRTLRISLYMLFARPATAPDFQRILPKPVVDIEIYVRNEQPYWPLMRRAMKIVRQSYDAVEFLSLKTITMSFIDKREAGPAFIRMRKDLHLMSDNWDDRVCFKAIRKAPSQPHEDILALWTLSNCD
jgi:hypothetical protein